MTANKDIIKEKLWNFIRDAKIELSEEEVKALVTVFEREHTWSIASLLFATMMAEDLGLFAMIIEIIADQKNQDISISFYPRGPRRDAQIN